MALCQDGREIPLCDLRIFIHNYIDAIKEGDDWWEVYRYLVYARWGDERFPLRVCETSVAAERYVAGLKRELG